MSRILTLDDLQKKFDASRQDLSRRKDAILALAPLPDDFSRDVYSFSYLRAERALSNLIAERLNDVSWLPIQLDPDSELILENKSALKRWLNSPQNGPPNSLSFGNDFIHAATRVAMTSGWDSSEFQETALRIGTIFHDLSCLIGLIYYGAWMAENGILGVPVSGNPDLETLTQEIASAAYSPEVATFITRRHELEKRSSNKKILTPSFVHIVSPLNNNDPMHPIF
ncbi:MAG: hypothetical protein PHS57_00535 [Alphaproteobacteria bacterium]|nr:hypothetical protein [Alphaproteobacteria bacterium]